MSLAAQPTDGLAITLADGSPLPRSLKTGDELLFRLFLDQPATDAIVELLRDSWYEPVRINGEPYVQLLKSGKEKDGRYWSAVVKLGPKTDKFKVAGYPVLFRAADHRRRDQGDVEHGNGGYGIGPRDSDEEDFAEPH